MCFLFQTRFVISYCFHLHCRGQRVALAVEPIATIGKPQPEKHVFLSNDKYLRVVRTHIQIVDSNSGVVVDEFADLIQDRWDGRNKHGELVSSGIYMYTIHAGNFSATRKMLIRK